MGHLWDIIDCAMMTTLNTNSATESYKSLTKLYSISTDLLSGPYHIQYKLAFNAFNEYTVFIKINLLRSIRSNRDKCSQTFFET